MNSCCESNNVKKPCPKCGVDGEFVKYETVSFLAKDIVSVSNGSDYFLCLDDECDVVYYNDEQVLYTIDIEVPISHKTDSKIHYVCYCSKMTKEELEKEIKDKNLKSLKDVIKYTKAMNISDCVHRNPKGTCCSIEIRELLNQVE
ncbi:(2Fe-2S)-binding protein [Mycoplasmatota bacterium WC44]